MKKFYTSEEKNRIIMVLSRVVTMCLIILVSSFLKAENIVSAGTSLKVVSATTLVSSEGLTIKSGATLDIAGTLILKKNLVNENASANSIGSGTVIFSGTVAQALNGPNVIQNLTINNPAGVTNGGENRVNGVLTLTSGRLTLGANNLILGTSATIAGAPSASAMVVATDAGQMRKSFSAAGSFSFPVGDNTGTAEYAPVTVSFTGGSYGAGNYVGVNLANSAYPGATGSYINRYWNVTQSGITGFTCNATFKYMQADVVGTENLIYCLRINPASVVYFSATNTATDILTANGITEFGTFTGVQQLTNKTFNLTTLLEGLYDGAGTMSKAQNAGGDQFTGTTADQINVELHNPAMYATKIFTVNNVNLSTTGTSSITIPGILSGSYYVTVRHRNSIETVTAAPVSFAGGTISYSFSGPAQAYGGNLQLMADGQYAIYAGDINQDGIVDGSDMGSVDNASQSPVLEGYYPQDANGDGIVDGSDIAIVDNNSQPPVVQAIRP